jgi:hypothetical protein
MTRYDPEHLDNAKAAEAAFEPVLAKLRELIADSARDEHFNAEDSHACLDEMDGFFRSIIDNMKAAGLKQNEALRQKEAA